ncbi:MAG: hypothetical protein SNJ69_12055 [Chloroflexaceae bacterium]
MRFGSARLLPHRCRRLPLLVALGSLAALLVACAPAPDPAAGPSSAVTPAGVASPVSAPPDPTMLPDLPAADRTSPVPAATADTTVPAPASAGAPAPQPVATVATSPGAVARDPDAEEVHHRWVLAMLSGNEDVALELAAEPDSERRGEHVRKQLEVTASWLRFSNLIGIVGPYLDRFEVLGIVPGADAERRIGLSQVLFARGSSCFATHLVLVAGSWRVVEWEPGGDACHQFIDRSLPGPLPTDEARSGAEDTHAGWVAAMFGGDPTRAETLLLADDAEGRQSMFRTLVFLTDYVVKANEESYGPFQRYELIPTYAESARYRVGYARAVYERGHMCFRADLHYLDSRWRVKKWDVVIPEACEA